MKPNTSAAAFSLAVMEDQYLIDDQGCCSSRDKLSQETGVYPSTRMASCSLLQTDMEKLNTQIQECAQKNYCASQISNTHERLLQSEDTVNNSLRKAHKVKKKDARLRFYDTKE